MTKESTTGEIKHDAPGQLSADQEQINRNVQYIGHKILVLSGKGGVGKSSIAANLAVWLSLQGQRVGLLDIDIHGPSIPRLLNLEKCNLHVMKNQIDPIVYHGDLKVMSIGFLLPDDSAALIWRGPMKHSVIRQFVADVNWGALDWLIVDCPPGTGDEPLSIVQLLDKADGAVVVTTPQQLAVTDVKKCITFCRQLQLPILGVVENMSGFICPHCRQQTNIFSGAGGRQMAQDFGVPFLGSIPIDADMVVASDSGQPFIYYYSQSPAAAALDAAFTALFQSLEKKEDKNKEPKNMKVAIPLAEGRLCPHFGHCETFAVVDVDQQTARISHREDLTPPPHEPGVLPSWLAGLGVNVIIAGGMGQRAKQLFDQNHIEVVVGAPADSPENLIAAYLDKTLPAGENLCDH